MEKEIITLADQEINERIENHEHFLKHIEQLVDWEKIRSILNQVELKRDSVAGRDAYSTEVMFRIMLIQSLYSLSDYQMEDQLICNMMFLWFSHLSMDNPVPDHSTISRWRSGFWEKGTKRSKYTFFSGKLISQLENNP